MYVLCQSSRAYSTVRQANIPPELSMQWTRKLSVIKLCLGKHTTTSGEFNIPGSTHIRAATIFGSLRNVCYYNITTAFFYNNFLSWNWFSNNLQLSRTGELHILCDETFYDVWWKLNYKLDFLFCGYIFEGSWKVQVRRVERTKLEPKCYAFSWKLLATVLHMFSLLRFCYLLCL